MAKITINKWEEFQPRKDRTNHTWFRLENSIAFSRTLYKFTPDQKWFWVCLLAQASKSNSAVIEYDAEYFEDTFGVSRKKMEDALQMLQDRGAITFEGGNQSVSTGVASVATGSPTDRQTDNTDITDRQPAARFGFQKAFDQYPIKIRGTDAEKRYKNQILTEKDEADLNQALSNYRAMLAIETWRKPKQTFAAFLGTKASGFFWRDFIDWRPPEGVSQTADDIAERLISEHQQRQGA